MNSTRFCAISLFLGLLFCTEKGYAQYFIGTQTTTFVDASRSNRNISTDIYYPVTTSGSTAFAAGQFPVVVFGHGFTISTADYNYIWQTLVPLGYIVALPKTESGLFPNHTNFGADLAFVGNQIVANNSLPSSIFYTHVVNKIAIMGHSMGGGCTFLAAQNNPNITTIITLAAAVTNPSSTTAAANVTCPALNIAGAEDCVAPTAQHQIPMYAATASSCKTYYEIIGGTHCWFVSSGGGTCLFGEGTSCAGYGPFITQSEQNAQTQEVIVPWLNYWLKNDCDDWLNGFVAHINNGGNFTYQSTDISCGISPPNVDLTASTTTLCNGESTILTASGGNTYVWSDSQTGAAISVSPASSSTYTVTVSNLEGCSQTAAVALTVSPNCDLFLQLQVWLQGAYHAASGLMKTTLKTENLLPLQQPYNALPWQYAGTESVATAADFPANTVDWLLIDLVREADSGLAARKAVLLLNNGQVVEPNGTTNISFSNLAGGTNYYVVIRHRNHLPIATAFAQPLFGTLNLALTTPSQVLSNGTTPQLVILNNNLYGMYAGDMNADGNINLSDFALYNAQRSALNEYKTTDVNLDRLISVADFNLYLPNSSIVAPLIVRY